jgi:hypothetical protein
MAGWSSASLDDVVTIDGGRLEADWKPLRHVLGIGAFGVNAWLGAGAGERVIEEHDEAGDQGQEELYVVLSGRATFTVDGSVLDAPAGTCVAVLDASLTRGAVAAEDGTVVLAVGAVRGEGFTPSDWEQRELASLDER